MFKHFSKMHLTEVSISCDSRLQLISDYQFYEFVRLGKSF